MYFEQLVVGVGTQIEDCIGYLLIRKVTVVFDIVVLRVQAFIRMTSGQFAREVNRHLRAARRARHVWLKRVAQGRDDVTASSTRRSPTRWRIGSNTGIFRAPIRSNRQI
jgi:hypothetical protein